MVIYLITNCIFLLTGGRSTPVLHIVDNLPVVSNEECAEAYQEMSWNVLPNGITDDFICAGLKEGGKDACQVKF